MESAFVYELEIYPETDAAPEDWFASGDAELDKQVAADIRERIAAGDEWAWFRAEVRCHVRGYPEFSGTAHLGACSYENREEFERDSYFDDLKEEARSELMERVRGLVNILLA